MIQFLSQPWHWSVSGFMITVVMFLLIYLGKKFGVSSSFQAICSIGGAGKWYDYFDYDWKTHNWLLLFVMGAIIGGGIGVTLLASPNPVAISSDTIAALSELNIATPTTISEGDGFLPEQIFNLENLLTFQGFIVMVVGGFLIGFGTRWAGGCTSGHAITGLANLQLPSLVAVIGFFIGGLTMTHLLFPLIFNF